MDSRVRAREIEYLSKNLIDKNDKKEEVNVYSGGASLKTSVTSIPCLFRYHMKM